MSDNIKVAIKVRPLIKREKEQKLFSQWHINENAIGPLDFSAEPFRFDNVFAEKVSTKSIYEEVVRPLVGKCLQGINGTIFAYGQTSSGKTYTMTGTDDEPGIMRLAVQHIFDYGATAERQFLFRISFIEIYNEKIFDLLDNRNSDIKIQETQTGDVKITCNEVIVNSTEQVINFLRIGNNLKRMEETNMNERSSRSHTIFRIIIESREAAEADAVEQNSNESLLHISNLNLVDLAGSEKADQTGAAGSRLKEGSFINKSLLSLSLVIKQLSESNSAKFINYRDSKLTRILQASLGGNSMTAIICTVTPTAIEETKSTLLFATRAKSIKNQPIINEIVSDGTMMRRLENEIKRLKRQLEDERSKNSLMQVEKIEKEISQRETQFVGSFGRCNANKIKSDRNRRRTWGPSTELIQPSEGLPVVLEEGDQSLGTDQTTRVSFPSSECRRSNWITTDRGSPNLGGVTFLMDNEDFIPSEDFEFSRATIPLKSPTGRSSIDTEDRKKIFVATPMALKKSRRVFNDLKCEENCRCEKLQIELEELQAYTRLEKDLDVNNKQDELHTLKNELSQMKLKLDISNSKCMEYELKISRLMEQDNKMNKELDKLKIDLAAVVEAKELAEKDKVGVEIELQNWKVRSERRETELLELMHEIQVGDGSTRNSADVKNTLQYQLLVKEEANQRQEERITQLTADLASECRKTSELTASQNACHERLSAVQIECDTLSRKVQNSHELIHDIREMKDIIHQLESFIRSLEVDNASVLNEKLKMVNRIFGGDEGKIRNMNLYLQDLKSACEMSMQLNNSALIDGSIIDQTMQNRTSDMLAMDYSLNTTATVEDLEALRQPSLPIILVTDESGVTSNHTIIDETIKNNSMDDEEAVRRINLLENQLTEMSAKMNKVMLEQETQTDAVKEALLEKLQFENSELNKKYKRTVREFDELSSQMMDIVQESDDLKLKLQNISTNIESESIVATYKSEIEILKLHRRQFADKIKSLFACDGMNCSSDDSFDTIIMNMDQWAAKSAARISLLEKEMVEMQEVLRRLNDKAVNEVENLKEVISEHAKTSEDLQQQLDSVIQESNWVINETVSDDKNEISELTAKIDDLLDVIAANQVAIKALENDLDEVVTLKNNMMDANETKINELTENFKTELRSQADELNYLRNYKIGAERMISRTDTGLTAFNAVVDDLSHIIKTKDLEITNLKKEQEEISTKDLRQIIADKDDEIIKLQNIELDLSTKIEDLQIDALTKDVKIEKLDRTLNEMEMEMYNVSYDNNSAHGDDDKSQSLISQIVILQEMTIDKQNEIENLNEEKSILIQKLDEVVMEVVDLKESQGLLQKVAAELHDSSHISTEMNGQHSCDEILDTSHYADLNETSINYQLDNTARNMEIKTAKLIEEKSALVQKLEEAEASYAALKKESTELHKSLETQINNYKIEIKTYSSQKIETDQVIDRLESENTKLITEELPELNKKIQELVVAIKTKEVELVELRNLLETQENTHTINMKTLSSQKSKAENVIDELETENSKLITEEIPELNKMINVLSDALKSKESELTELKLSDQRFDQLSDENIQLKMTKISLELNVKTLEREIAALKSANDDLKINYENNLTEFENNCEKSKITIAQLNSEIKTFDEKYKTTQSEAESQRVELNTKITNLTDQVDALTQERQNQIDTNTDLTAQIEENNKIIKNLRNQLSERESLLRDLQSNENSAEVKFKADLAVLTAECYRKSTELVTVTENYETCMAKHTQLLREFEAQKENITDLEARKAMIAEEKRLVEQQMKKMESQHSLEIAEYKQLQSKSSEKIKSLDNKIVSLEATVTSQSEAKKLQEKLTQHQKEYASLGQKYSVLEIENAASINRMEQLKIINIEFQAKTIDLEKQLAECEKTHLSKIGQLEADLNTLTQKLREKRQRIVELEKKKKDGDGNVSGYNDLRIRLMGENSALKQSNKILSDELDKYQQKQKSDRKIRRQSNHDHNRSSLSSFEMHSTLVQTDATTETCMCAVNDVKIKELKKENTLKDCHITALKLRVENNHSKEEMNEMKDTVRRACYQRDEMEREVLKLRTSVQKMTKQGDDHLHKVEELSQLKSRYEELKKNCQIQSGRLRELENMHNEKENDVKNLNSNKMKNYEVLQHENEKLKRQVCGLERDFEKLKKAHDKLLSESEKGPDEEQRKILQQLQSDYSNVKLRYEEAKNLSHTLQLKIDQINATRAMEDKMRKIALQQRQENETKLDNKPHLITIKQENVSATPQSAPHIKNCREIECQTEFMYEYDSENETHRKMMQLEHGYNHFKRRYEDTKALAVARRMKIDQLQEKLQKQ